MKFGEFVLITKNEFYSGTKGVVIRKVTQFDYLVKLDLNETATFNIEDLKSITFGEYTGVKNEQT